ncbi:helicase HerA domain-containing protein [Mycolicibacterium sp.]|uniref:helicase HerA domain-containing protein n=1 Tax=Mycolicibacterium sp. TaxID=2320850 RepID=UPI003D0F439B
MDPLHREALTALRLTWAPTSDDLWRPQAATHVRGLNEHAVADVLDGFGDAARDDAATPLGVVIRGPAGSGKTHLLGQIRERVQAGDGFFFVVELLDAASFWESVRSGILESLGRPGTHRETQLKDLLWELSSLAHVSRADRRAIIGDDDLEPETLDRFVKALATVAKETVRQCHQTLRALVLLGAADFTAHDVGEAFLQSGEEFGAGERAPWGLRAVPESAQTCVRDISRLVALAGPAVLAVDQIDTLLAQSVAGDGDHGVLEQVAHGLMALRQTVRRTVPVVACLPSVWELVRERATASVADRFRVTRVLDPLPSADVGRAILERRFTASYAGVGFVPPYPSWPIAAAAFEEAPSYTPRQLLIRADTHVRECLAHGAVVELHQLRADAAPTWETASPNGNGSVSAALDRRFAEYRQRAVVSAAVSPEGEDVTMPELLSAALTAWIAERDGEQTFVCDPPPGAHVVLHARLRESLDRATDDERHWAFRAVAATNAIAVQNRVRKALTATGVGSERRRLFLLRNTPWPSGPKTAALVEEFHARGGRVLPLTEDDVRTMTALRDLIHDDHPDLPGWLRARRPAHGLTLLAETLGDGPAVGGESGVEPESEAGVEPEAVPDYDVPDHELPIGRDLRTEKPVSVRLSALRKHIAIFAGSGSGKTVLIRRLVEECALRGVSSIVLDPNNDLSRLGTAWPQRPAGWQRSDDARAEDYLRNTEVTIWTPRRTTGRPLSFQPLPDFTSVVDDYDEFIDAVESACAALEPRALIAGQTKTANRARAVLREALQYYGRTPVPTLDGFIELLADLPDDISNLAGAGRIAADLSQDLHAAMVNDPMFGGAGTPVDPGVLLTPSPGYRARVSVISMVGLSSDEQRQSFVNQLQMALFAWIKRNPAGERPLGGLLVMDEAQNFAPAKGFTACTRSTLALSSQARKYGLGLVFATQAPKSLHNNIPGNAATQFYGLLNAPAQIEAAREMARAKGGLVDDISRLRAGHFYVATEGEAFHRIVAPLCLSYHPASPPSAEEVLALAGAISA